MTKQNINWAQNVKVLRLEDWAAGFDGNTFRPSFIWDGIDAYLDQFKPEHGYIRMEPVFNRNGYYYDRVMGIAWIELEGHTLLLPRTDDFLFALNNYELEKYTQAHLEALLNESMRPFLTKALKKKINEIRYALNGKRMKKTIAMRYIAMRYIARSKSRKNKK